MKTNYFFWMVLWTILPFSVWAQCPPPGFPDPGNTCVQAPILCENLDGYCSTINNNNIAQSFPGCPGWQLNNDEWFAFYAGTTTITIQVTPMNCSSGSMMGLQAGIYEGCGPPWNAVDLQCSCTEDPFILSSTNFVVGQVYWFVMDGCAGNVCDYTIDVLDGSTVGAPPADPGPLSGPAIVCAGNTNNYTLDPVTGATIYNWTLTPSLGSINDDDNAADITWGTAGGTAQLCVDVANLCYSNPVTSCMTIEVLPTPTATISGSGNVCAGIPGNIDLTVTFTGDAPWEFVYTINGVPQAPIQTSDNPYTLTVTGPGTYALQSVSSVDGNCDGTVSGSSVITETTLASTFVVTNAECGQSDGAINLTPGGGTAPYTFSWGGGETTEDLNNVPPGSYTVTVTDVNGCTEVLTIDVNDDPITINISGTVVANTTCNGGNGSIDITVTPSETYTYTWSNGETTEDISNLEPGSYTVTVSLGTTCSAEATFEVPDEPNEPIITGTPTESTCDLSNGSINISVSGGVPPYTFNWGTGETTEDLADIPAGTYTITVTGANGCTSELSVTVGNNNPPITITGTVIANTSCNGGNGSINITVTPPNTYTFNWSNGETTEDIGNLDPGSYTVTVSAGGTCTAEATFDIPDEPNEPIITGTPTESTCDLSNGSINISVSGGVPPYTFNWGTGETTEDLADIPAGTYTITVTGANGCTSELSVTVGNNNPPININANITPNTTCNGGNGAINITVTPPGSYTYEWSDGSMTEDLDDMPPGSYSVTVYGAGSCSATASFDIPDQPNEPVITANVTPSTCDLDNGSINISVSGGVPPYVFSWGTGQTTEDLSNIPAGSYDITVTGANGCSSSLNVSVPNNNPPITINGTVVANTTCIGGNGSITLNVTPPNAYTYLWSTGQTTPNLTNLEPGSYTVTVSAGGTCTQVATFVVPDNPNTPNLSFTTINPICGLSNGSINLSVSGGVPPYTYSWSNGANTQDISNLPPGSYDVVVTGANGCTSTVIVNLDNEDIPITLSGTVTGATSCITGNGSIVLSLDPPNLSVVWSTGSTSSNLQNLEPGSYTVTVSAGGTCTQEQTFIVPDDSETPVIAYDIYPAYCSFSNGSIDIEVFAGVSPYTYAWSTGANTQDISNLASGNYAVTVTTALGCTHVEFFNVWAEDLNISIAGTVSDDYSCIDQNGFIDIDVTPAGMYNYSWSNNAMTEDLNNLPAGVYTVTVTQGSCIGVSSFEVFDIAVPPNLAIALTPATCSQDNGSINLTPTGASPPYDYDWSTGATTQDLSNLPPGTYTVTVTDFFGCSNTAMATITSTDIALNITGAGDNNTSCLSPNGAIDINVTPAGSYSYTWSNTATTEDLSNLPAGTYTVTVSAGGNCTASANFVLINDTSDPELTAAITPSICSVDNGAIDLSVSNGTMPYTFIWSNMAMTEDINNVFPGLYSVTVTDANGCSADTTLDVPNNASTFSLAGVTTALTSCASPNGAVDLTVTPAGPYTYLWSNGAITEDLSNLSNGTYTVSVTESGSCTASATFIIANNLTYPSLNQSITPEVCDLVNGGINLTVTGGATPYSFNWSNGAMTEDLIDISAGNYVVTVTGANGCTASASPTVPGNAINFSLSAIPTGNTSCVAVNGAINLDVSPVGTYTYAWSNGQMTEDLSNLAPGAYIVTVSAGGSCTSTATYTVAQNALPPLVAQNTSPALCGQNSGAVNLTVSAGSMPYNFIWSNGAMTEDISNVPSGLYSVTVTGANGCSATASSTVMEDVIIPNITALISANTACVAFNGAIDVSITPALNYTITWSNGSMNQDLTNLAPGVYTITAAAGGGCTADTSFTVANQPVTPQMSTTTVESTCDLANGGIDLTVSTGTIPFTYLWSNGAMTADITAVVAGTYTVTVTDANGCTNSISTVIGNNNPPIDITGTITENTNCVVGNGAVEIQVMPANAYTFTWSNGPSTQDISDLPAGDYTVTVSGGGSCTATAMFTVPNVLGSVQATGTQTNILCFGDLTGTIDLDISGGTLPYSIIWTPVFPGNPQSLSGLAAGNYSVVVTDDLGCSVSASFNITQPAADVQIICTQQSVVSQPGASDGAGSVNISGGVAPYVIEWSPGSTQANVPAGPFDIDNLSEGNYDVTVTDANGCTQICGFVISTEICETALGTMSGNLLTYCGAGCISANYNMLGQFLDPDDVLQFVLHEGNGNQIINELARSDQPTFCFDPNLMSYGATYYISAVAGDDDGTGNVLLSDFCTVVSIGTPIEFRETPQASIATPGALNCVVDQVDLNGSSDLPGASFVWSTSNGQLIGNANQAMATAGSAGNYTLVVQLNGCADTTQVSVSDLSNQPVASILASPDDILDCQIDEILLSGTIEGSLNANAIWFSNGQVYANGTTLLIEEPGSYEFIILDTISMCSDTAIIIIDEDQSYPPLFVDSPDLINCYNPTVVLSGGSSFPGISFSWVTINGSDTTLVGSGNNYIASAPGTYYIIGIDPTNNCTNILDVMVDADLTYPNADAGTDFSIDCFGEIAFLDGTASTGEPGLLFEWTSPDGELISGANTASPEINQAGSFVLVVTNPGNGCSDTDEIVVVPEEPSATITAMDPPCFGERGMIVIDTVIGGEPPIVYSIDGGANFTTQNIFFGLNPGDYTVLIEDANGCSTSVDATINETAPFEIILDAQYTLQLGDSILLNPMVNVPLSDIGSVGWSPSDGISCDTCLTTFASPTESMRYQVTVVTKNGCEDRAPVLLFVDRRVDVYIPNVFSPDGDGKNDVFMIFADPKGVSSIKSFQVFSRWGELVYEYYNFEPNNPAYGWDGTFRGEELNPAVFVWYAIIEYTDGREVLYEGDVTIKR